jgi:hypothetical protein
LRRSKPCGLILPCKKRSIKMACASYFLKSHHKDINNESVPS